jgi:hypothetical protein
MNKRNTVIVSVASVVALAIVGTGVGIAIGTQTSAPPSASTSETAVESPSPSEANTPAPEPEVVTPTLEQNLAFIIEEEKLAFDVYTVLGDLWGSRTMQNIVSSETSHQAQVATLLVSYGIVDPRSSEIGVFTNPDLQALYNTLLAQGSVSEQAAMEVGVFIEETDIADLDAMMATISEQDVLTVLESLRSGSVNHLAAFQRQLA